MRLIPRPRLLAPALALALLATIVVSAPVGAATPAGCVNVRYYHFASTTDVVFQLAGGVGVVASARDPSAGVTVGLVVVPDLCRNDATLRDASELVHATHASAQGALPMLP